MKGNIDITTNGYWYDDKSKYLVHEYGYPLKDKDLETLYDLIKADLIEKVGD